MITYASRKRTFSTFDEEEEQDAHTLPIPPASSPKALQPSSGNTTKSRTVTTSEKRNLVAGFMLPDLEAISSHQDHDEPPSSPSLSFALKPRKIPLLRTSHSTPARSASQHVKRQKFTQMTIDLGGPPQVRCKQCGMEYIPSNLEDRKLHAVYHAASVGGVDVPASLRGNDSWRAIEQVDGSNGKRDTIVEVGRHSKLAARRFAKKVLEVVERELGAAETSEHRLWDVTTIQVLRWSGMRMLNLIVDSFKVYLYIRGSKCVGLLLAQRVSRAQRQNFVKTACASITTSKVSKVGTPDVEQCPAGMGVSRLWVSRESQRCGIATEMLDAARKNFIGTEIAKEQVAFSQPTALGLSLITKYIRDHRRRCDGGVEADGSDENRAGWLMYNERDAEASSL